MAKLSTDSPTSTLAEIESRPASAVAALGTTLVVAPHPDDESLGCGGAIRLLRDHGVPVTVVCVTDGTGSHRGSRSHPPDVLGRLRTSEATQALTILGVTPEHIHFLHLEDQSVPGSHDTGFAPAVAAMTDVLRAVRPETVILPWRRDPHCDHRAVWQITMSAIDACDHPPKRCIEYAIWLWELGNLEDQPSPEEILTWRLDISSVVRAKRAAIACHRSQTTDLIRDDPHGFRLSPEMLERFTQPWEIYLEPLA